MRGKSKNKAKQNCKLYFHGMECHEMSSAVYISKAKSGEPVKPGNPTFLLRYFSHSIKQPPKYKLERPNSTCDE